MSNVTEKQLHKQSLTKVVDYLNEKNNNETENTEEVKYSKKKIRQLSKKAHKKKAKTCTNVKLENNNIIESTKSIALNEKNANNEEKLTRKERRMLKIKNNGKGLSSKEFMKVYKEGDGRKIVKEDRERSKLHIPSKSKLEYPKVNEKEKNRFKPKAKKRIKKR